MTPVTPAFVPANGAIEAAISIAVLVIAFIGWLVQIVGQAKGPQPPGPANRPRPVAQRPPGPRPGGPPDRPQPRRDERLQSEIDAFLREVAGGRRPKREEEEVAIEIIPDEELPDEEPRRLAPRGGQFFPPSEATVPPITAAPASPTAAAPTGQLSEWDREQQRRRERLLSTLSERHLEATPLGQDLRRHVEQTMAESLRLRQEKEQAERRLAEARAEIRAMRAEAVAGPAGAPASAAAGRSRFAALLKNRRTVKDAIVINEILGRPRGLNPRP
ncbi:MAG TPA: hypothetical protein VF170_11615 [Planctomycetaceae bacterium]